jgi:hypothetical protein
MCHTWDTWRTSRSGIRKGIDRKHNRQTADNFGTTNRDRNKSQMLSKYFGGIVFVPYINCREVASGNGKIIFMRDWTEVVKKKLQWGI